MPQAKSALEPLFMVNIFVDLAFALDIFFQFRLMFPRAHFQSSIWEGNPKRIAEKYLAKWFWLDLISTIPYQVSPAP